ncbi:MAG: phage integrase N-terminal SAM-like domain-containing protein [Nitrosomonas sp.]|nr:phage integrase N-terminal SAM-like domain-containing protein [Nitrosomonas sp.]MDP1950436.1 phage integrase N-terminal SAM-like domain-containing protein [Nitrosomonas sp.]
MAIRQPTKTNTTSPPAKKLLDQVRDKIRFKHDSLSTENTYISWIKQYIIFNGKRHPTEIGAVEVARQQGVFFFRRVPYFVK